MKMKQKRTAILSIFAISFWLWIGLANAAAAASVNEKENQQMAGILYAYTNVTSDTGEEIQKKKIFLPLRKTDVHLEVFAGIVKATVTQEFTNDTTNALEAIYVFPLPSKAAVTDMVLKVGDRIIRSVIKERQEAKKTYEAAKAAGKKTALLEQERPNIFTTSVANFLPGETVEISLSYMEPVEYQTGIYTINFPMVVGQRYIPISSSDLRASPSAADSGTTHEDIHVPDANRLNPPLLHPNLDSQHRLSLNANITGIPVKTIVSTTHAIDIEEISSGENEEKYRVSPLKDVVVPDSDFNMKVYLKEMDSPQLSYIYSRKETEAYGMVTVFPPVSEGDPHSSPFALPRDVIFLIDTSGSMSGMSIGQAKAGLLLCLKMLRPEDHFTIVRFASDYSYFSPDLKPAAPGNIEDAKHYINGLIANGGTEMQRALQYVLGIPKNHGSMKMIVFLTDGAVGNEDSLIRLLSNHLGQSRLFTFGIGSAPNEYLMRKMAEIGRGQSRFIHSHEDIGEVMANFFKTLDSPVLTDISLEWRDAAGNRVSNMEFYPNPCPDVYYQRPLQVFIKHPESAGGELILSGLLGGKTVEYRYGIDAQQFRQSQRVDAVDRVFGKAKIKELMYRHIRANSNEERELLRQEIIDVSLHHQVLSKFTARVAVEERITRNPDGELDTVKVNVPLPKGWDPAKFHATASDMFLWLIVGVLLIAAALIDLGVRRFINSR
ncbi:MAG: marine proteobacterial sortase target protein [Candidatus Aminicenantes bacterium]|nr:marine proteobacterial sortase target protein [Candidatus Aminicenantes bacterium]NIM84065.1 marine proteobacterial sortase target protein [Candidatus Aminicenantes bacterium]NIN23527.1 marine proteobacterial sortase target protein [Candidatus Aminicenantes bacterium]NIN47232.1 marine proteobacterial sortase target protein [Candidatus Aminicenantes bacterium]NIN90159.1 marine proteobacterial sortase target protein [Candidatus Aminicenantes bacterium]